MSITLVKDLKLQPQDKTLACWYFSAKMMYAWAQANKKTGVKDPSTVTDPPANLQQLYEWNSGYSRKTCKQLASRLGLKALERKKRSFEDFKVLIDKSPIWAAGAKSGVGDGVHVVVIGGVADTGLYLYDPLPLNRGQKVWRTWDWLEGFFALDDDGFDANLLVV